MKLLIKPSNNKINPLGDITCHSGIFVRGYWKGLTTLTIIGRSSLKVVFSPGSPIVKISVLNLKNNGSTYSLLIVLWELGMQAIGLCDISCY